MHVAALMIDPFVPFGVVDVLGAVRFEVAPSRDCGGVIGLDLILVVEVTSLLMCKLPRRWWHRIHLSSLVLLAAAMAGVTAFGIYPEPVVRLAAAARLAVGL